MAARKLLKLVAEPTFKAKVGFPLTGLNDQGESEEAEIIFTFKHKTKSELEKFMNSRKDVDDLTTFLEIVVGWDLDDEFTKENVEILLENHINVALRALTVYVEELVKARVGN